MYFLIPNVLVVSMMEFKINSFLFLLKCLHILGHVSCGECVN